MAENILFKTALNKAMAQCSRREYCIREIREKLNSWSVGTTDIEKIISTLIAENFLHEERFAKAFVKDKFIYNKWGRVKITAHLRSKGISGEIIKQALYSIDNDQYLKVLRDMISNHKRSVKAKNQYDMKAKLLRYGLSKGFESSILYEMLNESED